MSNLDFKIITKIFLLIFFINMSSVYSQNEDISIEEIGLFPKKETDNLYSFKVSGEYRFFSTYRYLDFPFQLSQFSDNKTLRRNIFINDDSQFPNLFLRFSGRPNLKTSWGFDLFTFQFLEGNIGPSYSNQISNDNLPLLYDPIIGNRLAGQFGLNLGMNLYGNFDTQYGSIEFKAGGIHWASLSPFTLATFNQNPRLSGLGTYSAFERDPWHPIGSSVEQRYNDFFKTGNIQQGERWGEKAFTGIILEASNLPKNLSFILLYGKTELNGGFSYLPNNSFGGQIRKNFPSGNFIGINSFNSNTFVDSAGNQNFGFNIHTVESNFNLSKLKLNFELGQGRYISESGKGNWGEAMYVEISPPKLTKRITILTQLFRVSPNVINNNSVFFNTSINQSSSIIQDNSVGSTTLLQPFASSIVPLGQMTNNRKGISSNILIEFDRMNFNLGIGSSSELRPISNQITYSHQVNQLTRSRFWRWNFPQGVGPYGNQNVIFRDVYETINLTDDQLGEVINKKYFSLVELSTKFRPRFSMGRLYLFSITRLISSQNYWSYLPIFNENAYVRQYNQEIEAYYAINSKFILSGYSGFERTIANYNTELSPDSGKPRNQIGTGYGLGLDITISKNTALYFRHRWFFFEDKSFELHKFKGTETIIELKTLF